jgi:hypothetical protein
MQFEESGDVRKVGEYAGYIISYLAFTTILYFVLTLLHRVPLWWNFFHTALVTLSIVIVGELLKKVLE